MTRAKQGDTVRVHYTGKLADGTVFSRTQEDDPLELTLGEGNVLPGFEQAVEGMEPGESKTVMVPPDQAYGERNPDMVAKVDRSELGTDFDLQVGQRLQIQQQDGQSLTVTVAELDESQVTLDGNHPLAGHEVTFEIRRLAG